MRPLTGAIRTYAWGSRTALAALQGRPVPTVDPEAELWLGAHPADPARVPDGLSLPDVIGADPVGTLGTFVIERFGQRLPYLLKVLAAEQPLSLQAHPDAEQARAGFVADAALPAGATRRYVDPYHKPELLVAIEEFDGLCGFRPPALTGRLLAAFGVPALDTVVAVLRGPVERAGAAEEDALHRAVELLVRLPVAEREPLVTAVVDAARKRVSLDEPAFGLAVRLGELYPDDIGVVLALMLNRVRLRPDEAVFMPAGNLHAYLGGVGIEVMAASDNVLRGGLTRKHVDVPELLRVLRYEPLLDPVLQPRERAPGVVGWDTPAAEFALVKAVASAGSPPTRVPGGGPRIVVCTAGRARCRAGASTLSLGPGEAAFLGAAEPFLELSAEAEQAVVFQASSSG